MLFSKNLIYVKENGFSCIYVRDIFIIKYLYFTSIVDKCIILIKEKYCIL